MMKNKLLFYIFLAFVFVNIVDAVTAFFILPGESNPIFLLTKSIIPIIIFKIIIILGLWFFINRNVYASNMQYYIFVTIVMYGTLIVGLGALSNIYGMSNPEVMQEASEATTTEKIQAYGLFASIMYLLPVLMCLIIFYIYDKTRNSVVVDKSYFEKKKWWQP